MPLTEEEHAQLLTLYRDRVAAYADVDDTFGERWRRWCGWLLDHGGELVVPHRHPEPDLDRLLDEGRMFGPTDRVVPGEDSQCHTNAAILWIDGAVAAIGTGYALSDDGLWRQHSWGLDVDGRRIETTVERLRYAGLALSDVAALKFAAHNAHDHLVAVLQARGPRADELAALVRTVRSQT